LYFYVPNNKPVLCESNKELSGYYDWERDDFRRITKSEEVEINYLNFRNVWCMES
jgi:hypothetical protein